MQKTVTLDNIWKRQDQMKLIQVHRIVCKN